MSTKFNITRPLELVARMVTNRPELDGRRKFRVTIKLADIEGRNFSIYETETNLAGVKKISPWTPGVSISGVARPMAWTVVIEQSADKVSTVAVRTIPFNPIQPIRK